MVVEKGQNVELSLVVCADPRPRVVAWEWGSSRLEAGSEMGMYVIMYVNISLFYISHIHTIYIHSFVYSTSRSFAHAFKLIHSFHYLVLLFINDTHV